MTTPNAQAMMTTKVITFLPETRIYEAMRTLLSNKISGAPVVDKSHLLVGILSEKDCFRVLTATAFDGSPVG